MINTAGNAKALKILLQRDKVTTVLVVGSSCSQGSDVYFLLKAPFLREDMKMA